MNRNRALALLSVTLPLLCAIPLALPSNPFETKLSADRQIVQALDRLTFGPRPGDEQAVRRMGLEKWIDLQLHPDRIPQNPALDAALEPYETLRMPPAAVANQYAHPMTMMMNPQPIMTLLSPDERRKVLNGTAEERSAVLTSLDPEKRKQVLAQLPDTNLESLPEFRQEAEDARREQQQQRQAEIQRRNPPLSALLTPEQRNILMRGTPEEVHHLIDSLDPEKRIQVAGAAGPQVLADYPDLRREGMMRRQPMQVMSMDLKAGRVFRAVYSSRQLEEVLTDFWLNHFNLFEGKNVQLVNNAYRAVLADYENKAIRPHVSVTSKICSLPPRSIPRCSGIWITGSRCPPIRRSGCRSVLLAVRSVRYSATRSTLASRAVSTRTTDAKSWNSTRWASAAAIPSRM